jgi:NlpC/P60 family protein
MLKQALIGSLTIILLGSCSSLKQLQFSDNKQKESQTNGATGKKEVKFLEGIDVNVESGPLSKDGQKPVEKKKPDNMIFASNNSPTENTNIERSSSLQLKYSLLLNTEVEQIRNVKIFEFIDNWYGTRYRLGGTTKTGIDCSAFSQLFFSTIYGISLPRTSKEQYYMSEKISRSHLQQGDLIFFNTRGGVSHVGIYLQNNKFVHAATSGGVMISDFFDPYWHSRFIGVGRMSLARKSTGESGVVSN